jgi:hypothetical protein
MSSAKYLNAFQWFLKYSYSSAVTICYVTFILDSNKGIFMAQGHLFEPFEAEALLNNI